MVQEALRAARPELREIAKRAGVTSGAMYKYSTGHRTPGRDVLRALAKALRQQAGELMAWADQLDAESNR
jgi:transcriptional regulator with XRE-family HTH domain